MIETNLHYLLEPYIKTGAISQQADGTFLFKVSFPSVSECPWDSINIKKGCMYSNYILNNCVSPQFYKSTGVQFVPLLCQDCWKVVVKPATLRELHDIWELQLKMNVASKCGIEMRHYTSRLYGGYWYNDTLEDGLACYSKVKELIGDMPILLKRGCTEIEMKFGDSAEWKPFDGQEGFEQRIRAHIVSSMNEDLEGDNEFKYCVHKNWMAFAYRHGDQTYKEFGGSPYPEYRTYQHLLDGTGT